MRYPYLADPFLELWVAAASMPMRDNLLDAQMIVTCGHEGLAPIRNERQAFLGLFSNKSAPDYPWPQLGSKIKL